MRKEFPAGYSILWMNGVQLIERQIEPFALVEMVRRERRLINGVRELGFNGKQAVSLLGHKEIASSKAEDANPRYDWTDRQEGDNAILWLNDLEDEDRYPDFPTTLTALLQRVMPGQIPPIAKNIFNLIVPVDFSDPEDVDVVARLISIMSRDIPLRFGLIPLTTTPDATAQAKVVHYILENFGIYALEDYLQGHFENPQAPPSKTLVARIVASHDLAHDGKQMTLEDILESDHYSERVKFAKKWAGRLKVNASPRVVFINGVVIPRDENWMQAMSMKLSDDLQTVQRGIFMGSLTMRQMFLKYSWKTPSANETRTSRRTVMIHSTS